MTMPGSDEIFRSIYGAWRIARFDRDAMNNFNLTIEGFWRSFYAGAAMAAGQAILLSVARARDTQAAQEVEPLWYFFVQLLSFLAILAAYPVVMIFVTRFLDLSHRFVSFIIVWNWSAVIHLALGLPITLVYAFQGGGNEFLSLFALILYGAILFYAVLVVRAGLQCAIGTAIGIVALDIILSLLVDYVSDGLL